MFEQAFRNIDDVLRKETGCTTELDYTEQTSWLLFLKYLDGLEDDNCSTQIKLNRALLLSKASIPFHVLLCNGMDPLILILNLRIDPRRSCRGSAVTSACLPAIVRVGSSESQIEATF